MALLFAALIVSVTAFSFWSFFLSMLFLFFLWTIGYAIASILGVDSELVKAIGGIVFVFLIATIAKLIFRIEEQ